MLPALLAVAICLSPLQDPPLKQVWKVEMDDLILGSPVVHRDQTFVASRRGKVGAFNTETGASGWTGSADAGVISTPAALKDGLFIPTGLSGSILNFGTGKRRPGSIGRAVRVHRGESRLYLLGGIDFDGTYQLGSTDFVNCLDVETGRLSWKSDWGVAPVGAIAESGGKLYLAGLETVFILDAKTGKEAGSWNHPATQKMLHGVTDRDRVIFQGDWEPATCYEVKERKELWRWSRGPESGQGVIPPVVVQGLVILSMLPEVVGLDSKSGAERWKQKLEAKAEFSQLPPAVRGKEVCIGANGKLFALDHQTGKVQWTLEVVKPDESFLAHQPVWSGDRLLYACGKTLYCYKPK